MITAESPVEITPRLSAATATDLFPLLLATAPPASLFPAVAHDWPHDPANTAAAAPIARAAGQRTSPDGSRRVKISTPLTHVAAAKVIRLTKPATHHLTIPST